MTALIFIDGSLIAIRQVSSTIVFAPSEVVIKVNDKGAFVNDAKIIATDVDASNGIIHIIDSVIMPPVK